MGQNNAAKQSNMLSEEQFRWNKDQAKKAELDAARQRATEALRQGRVSDSIGRLNAMFDGGKYMSKPVNASNLVEGQTYYDKEGNPVVWKPGMTNAVYLGNGGDKGKEYQGFTEDFFNQRAEDYAGHYMPQVQDQFGEARSTLKYGLGEAGLSQSSVANTDAAKLARDKLLREGEIKSKGQQVGSELRTRVNQVRANLMSQVQVANDPNEVMQAAGSQLNDLHTTPIQYDPIGSLFSAGAKAYGAYQNGQQAAQIGGGGGGGSGMPKSSGKTY